MKMPINEELRLRGFKDKDIPIMAELANNLNVARTLPDHFPQPYTRNDAVRYMATCKKEVPQRTFVIEYQGAFAGIVMLKSQDDVYRHSTEIGYWLGEPFWGKGIMPAVINRMLGYAFDDLDLHRVFARVFGFNKRSARVLEKSGFLPEGTLKDSIYKHGTYYDEWIWGIRRQGESPNL